MDRFILFKGMPLKRRESAIMRNLTVFEGLGIGTLAILIVLMINRRGVKGEDLILYLGSGCLFEILPTAVFGFLITCTHYIIFTDPEIVQMYAGMQTAFLLFELFLNGVLSLIAIIIAWVVLGRFIGIGFISAVSLGYYTYWLAV